MEHLEESWDKNPCLAAVRRVAPTCCANIRGPSLCTSLDLKICMIDWMCNEDPASRASGCSGFPSSNTAGETLPQQSGSNQMTPPQKLYTYPHASAESRISNSTAYAPRIIRCFALVHHIVCFFFNFVIKKHPKQNATIATKHFKTVQQVCWFRITAVNSATKRKDESLHSQTQSRHTFKRVVKKNSLAINDSFMSSDKTEKLTAWYPDALWELTDWWNNERATRWVDASASIRLFAPSTRANAMDTSSAGRPPPSSRCFWNGSFSCGERRRASATENKQVRRLLLKTSPPRLLALLFCPTCLHLLIAEALMALLSWFCHRRSSEGVIQLWWILQWLRGTPVGEMRRFHVDRVHYLTICHKCSVQHSRTLHMRFPTLNMCTHAHISIFVGPSYITRFLTLTLTITANSLTLTWS